MTPLAARLAAQIAHSGPISVAEYFARCLLDPFHGYYTTREPFGAGGDFITAPEVSQMFGELVGVWLAAAWEACGRPEAAVLAEVGPGRGTLMKDVLRTLKRIAPRWLDEAEILLIEASPRLRAIQAETLGDKAGTVQWRNGLSQLPAKPLFLVGNEFFDALPVRQYQKSSGRWRERVVGLDESGALSLLLGPGTPDRGLLPPEAGEQPDGTVIELSPAREAAMDAVAVQLRSAGGAALFFDYGHLRRGFGETLQAVRRHNPEDVLLSPGEADLTAHVDFAVLAAAARRHGLETRAATQGDFLLRMGLLERAGFLGARADEATQGRLRAEVERLAGPDAMGTLFKAFAVSRPGAELPALASFDPQ